jgi:hypothetical protein
MISSDDQTIKLNLGTEKRRGCRVETALEAIEGGVKARGREAVQPLDLIGCSQPDSSVGMKVPSRSPPALTSMYIIRINEGLKEVLSHETLGNLLQDVETIRGFPDGRNEEVADR